MRKITLLLILIMITFQLKAQFNCGDVLVDERDGQEYTTVLIGNQCWMAENLNIGQMLNQSGSTNQSNNGAIEKFCYENNQAECDEYGGLYQWDEMMTYQTGENIQGISPAGWHLPSDEEWMELEMFLGMSEADANETGFERGTNQGTQLQAGGGTGFDAFFGGIWYPDYGFVYNEDFSSPNGYYFTYFWSTTPGTYTDNYMYRNVNTQFETVTRWQAEKNFGYSVRCIADEYSTSYHFEFDNTEYEIVMDKKTWEDAAADAVAKNGFLVEVNSQEEQDAIYDAIVNGAGIADDYTTVNDGGGIAYVWIGATDKASEGIWLWDGDNDSEGINFWTGQGANGSGNGVAINGAYNNWGGTSTGTANEPDDYLNNQDAGAIALAGWPAGTTMLGVANEWNDIDLNNELYYIIEYENTSDVDNEYLLQTITVYPNPANEKIIISNKNQQLIKRVELSNILGHIVYLWEQEIGFKHEIDLTNQNKGVYLLNIYGSDNKIISSEKIIKQ